ncbi:hypothetical protein TNCT_310171 [Trichonephila clavata]|uniref:Uncharacterized protein n=1 Tax=Trichonephila clavata TaxID=2740835 RepID=A0A8X6LGA3_TRICU|nr:hypothetical protein TNCT_310171 [Trichonephila clavata]
MISAIVHLHYLKQTQLTYCLRFHLEEANIIPLNYLRTDHSNDLKTLPNASDVPAVALIFQILKHLVFNEPCNNREDDGVFYALINEEFRL